jgi:hypothetical protein
MPHSLKLALEVRSCFKIRTAPQRFPAFSRARMSMFSSGRYRLPLRNYEIQAPALPRSVHEPSVFENNR